MSTGDQKDILNPAGATADARGAKETENTSSGISIRKKRRKMMIAIPIKMPKNCHECEAMGISNIVGLKGCNDIYDFDERPEKCPLREICTLSCKKSINRYAYLDLDFDSRFALIKDAYESIMDEIAKEKNLITTYETKNTDPDNYGLMFSISIVRRDNDTEGAAS